MRERGLKFPAHAAAVPDRVVAPHAGAWIEIGLERGLPRTWWSLPMRERGLKCDNFNIPSRYRSRSPCGSVD